jgi:hypothetical protein
VITEAVSGETLTHPRGIAMQIAYCANCGKNTGHKRALGAGTILGAVVTGGASLVAVPLYGKRCIICGLTVEQATPQQPTATLPQNVEPAAPYGNSVSASVSRRDRAQGWLVLLGVILFFAVLWGSVRKSPSGIRRDTGKDHSLQSAPPASVPGPKGRTKVAGVDRSTERRTAGTSSANSQ